MKKSLTGLLIRMVVVAAVVMAGLVGSAAVAGADGSTGSGGGGPGGVSTTVAGHTYCYIENIGGTIWRIGVLNGVQIYNNPYPGCVGAPTPPVGKVWIYNANGGSTGAWGLCIAGFTVWDFYGTQSNPTAGWVVHRINVPSLCSSVSASAVYPSSFNWDVYSPNPEDSAGFINAGSPVSSATDPFISSVFTNSLNQLVSYDDAGKLTTGQYLGSWYANCTQYIQNPDTNYPADTAFQNVLWQKIEQWSPIFGPRAALAMADAVAASNGSVDYAGDTGAVPACASGANMTAPPTVPAASRPVFGSCVVPTQSLVGDYATSVGYQVSIPTAGGERVYEDSANGFPSPGSGPINWLNVVNNPNYDSDGPQGNNPYDLSYREAVYNTIGVGMVNLEQAYGSPNYGAYFGGLLNEPSNSLFLGINVAGLEASEYADCFQGQYLSSGGCDPSVCTGQPRCVANCDTPGFDAGDTISVDSPAVLQVGGELNPATFTSRADGFSARCTSECDAVTSGPTLTGLDWDLGISASGGYSQCADGTSEGCDYAIAGNTKTYSGTGAQIESSDTMTAGFYNATGSGQSIKASLDGGATGTYTVTWNETMSNGTYQSKTATVPFAPTIDVGSATALQVVAGVQTPG